MMKLRRSPCGPVYNGASTLGELVAMRALDIVGRTRDRAVVDGKSRNQPDGCKSSRPSRRADRVLSPAAISAHNAVMAGSARARGAYPSPLDDDLQNPPGE